jgi:CheY-like chemotaxis protein
VIDDEPVQLRTARRILEQLGYRVATAQSGEAALELLGAGPSDSEFHLVVLDMMMPDMDGLMTLAWIRAIRPGQRALIVTGYTPLEAVDQGLGQTWLSKPYTPAALGQAVRRALDG